MKMTIDSVERIEIDPTAFTNEVSSLRTQLVGMMFLANTIKGREVEYEQTKPQNSHWSGCGIDFDGTETQLPLITCYFHWFCCFDLQLHQTCWLYSWN